MTLDLLASNETSTSSHLNVPRPRMTVGFKVGLMLPDDKDGTSRSEARTPRGNTTQGGDKPE